MFVVKDPDLFASSIIPQVCLLSAWDFGYCRVTTREQARVARSWLLIHTAGLLVRSSSNAHPMNLANLSFFALSNYTSTLTTTSLARLHVSWTFMGFARCNPSPSGILILTATPRSMWLFITKISKEDGAIWYVVQSIIKPGWDPLFLALRSCHDVSDLLCSSNRSIVEKDPEVYSWWRQQ